MGTGGMEIHCIRLGVSNCFVLKGEQGAVVVDCGMPGRADHFARGLSGIGLSLDALRLIIVTHGHWDHIGSAAAIKERTGAPLAMHAEDRDWLEGGRKSVPRGVTTWGRIFGSMMSPYVRRLEIQTTAVDLVLEDQLSLAAYGIDGCVIHTPGHSAGSVSVLLESGDAFVGDLAMNGLPLRRGPGIPIFADDLNQVKASWKLLLDRGAKTIYPAHGTPFSADVFRYA